MSLRRVTFGFFLHSTEWIVCFSSAPDKIRKCIHHRMKTNPTQHSEEGKKERRKKEISHTERERERGRHRHTRFSPILLSIPEPLPPLRNFKIPALVWILRQDASHSTASGKASKGRRTHAHEQPHGLLHPQLTNLNMPAPKKASKPTYR